MFGHEMSNISGLRSTVVFLTLVMSPVAIASDGDWIGIVHDESELAECERFADAPIQAAARNGQFYGWAQIGFNWHKVSGRVTKTGHLAGRISSANALNPNSTPSSCAGGAAV